MLMRLRMLKLCVGRGHQVMKQLYLRVLQYYATVATERAGYVSSGYVMWVWHISRMRIKNLRVTWHGLCALNLDVARVDVAVMSHLNSDRSHIGN